MDKVQQDTIKKIDAALKSFKESDDYTNGLKKRIEESVKNNRSRFDNISEDDYNDRLKENATKKSNLVALLAMDENFKLWQENTSEKNKNFLYDLAQKDALTLKNDELKAFSAKSTINYMHYKRPEFELNSQYNADVAQKVTQKVTSEFQVQGQKHLATQAYAKKVIQPLYKDGPEFQKVCSILFEKVGDKWSDVLDSLKRAANSHELERAEDGKSLVLTTKALGSEQKFKFTMDANDKISEISAVPPNLAPIIAKMRETNKVDNTAKPGI